MKDWYHKPIVAEVPYEEVDFVWVQSHWDIHKSGTCKYQDELCEFRAWEHCQLNEEDDEWELPIVTLYALSWKQKIKYRVDQWCFETCVGYHWSYKDGKRGDNFHYRKPKWLYELIFKLYYKLN